MSNRKTYEASHNNVPVASILTAFRSARHELVDRLESLDADVFAHSALHPRLNVQMRLVDMLFFQAEHDDYHLARISELKKLFAKNKVNPLEYKFHAKTQMRKLVFFFASASCAVLAVLDTSTSTVNNCRSTP
jgi:hypothetical protein